MQHHVGSHLDQGLILPCDLSSQVPLLYVLLQQAIDAAIPLNRSDSEEGGCRVAGSELSCLPHQPLHS